MGVLAVFEGSGSPTSRALFLAGLVIAGLIDGEAALLGDVPGHLQRKAQRIVQEERRPCRG